jgi:hypothetical protein
MFDHIGTADVALPNPHGHVDRYTDRAWRHEFLMPYGV